MRKELRGREIEFGFGKLLRIGRRRGEIVWTGRKMGTARSDLRGAPATECLREAR